MLLPMEIPPEIPPVTPSPKPEKNTPAKDIAPVRKFIGCRATSTAVPPSRHQLSVRSQISIVDDFSGHFVAKQPTTQTHTRPPPVCGLKKNTHQYAHYISRSILVHVSCDLKISRCPTRGISMFFAPGKIQLVFGRTILSAPAYIEIRLCEKVFF